MRYFVRVFSYVWPYRRLALLAVVGIAITALVGLLTPWPFAILIDSVLGKEKGPGLMKGWFGGNKSQLLWFLKIRTNLTALFVISIFINLGMWFERFVIIASSLSNDYIPWAWSNPNITWADWGILLGSFGWFSMWFLLFAKSFPIVAIQEIKEMIPMPRKRPGGHH